MAIKPNKPCQSIGEHGNPTMRTKSLGAVAGHFRRHSTPKHKQAATEKLVEYNAVATKSHSQK